MCVCVLSAAGIESSKLPPAIDGHSFAPTLLGKAQPQPPFIYHDFGGPQDPGAFSFVSAPVFVCFGCGNETVV